MKSVQHQSVSPVNRLVQFVNRLSKIRPLQRQRRFLGNLPVLADSLDQLAQSILAVPENCTHTVLNQSAFKAIVFLAGGGRSIPAISLMTQRISWRFSHARLRDALDASRSSSSFWRSCSVIDMVSFRPQIQVDVQKIVRAQCASVPTIDPGGRAGEIIFSRRSIGSLKANRLLSRSHIWHPSPRPQDQGIGSRSGFRETTALQSLSL